MSNANFGRFNAYILGIDILGVDIMGVDILGCDIPDRIRGNNEVKDHVAVIVALACGR